MTSTSILVIASILGASSILLGALAAHKLKKHFSADLLQSFETGVKYQMYHALALLILGFEFDLENSYQQAAIWLLVIGTILFSWSIYGLCFSSSSGSKWRWLGPITPLGGLCMFGGWILLAIGFLK
ncbi:MAG: DUF423 domain-containing protein [Flavobacteriaceae bacterium]|nr:DUF423 domain-containing protein [Flavobacteriaceae bacterium]